MVPVFLMSKTSLRSFLVDLIRKSSTISAMIDLADLRNRPAAYQDAANKKGIELSVQEFLDIDANRRALQQDVDSERNEKNAVSKKIPAMSTEEREAALATMKELSDRLKEKEQRLQELSTQWEEMQLMLPSIPLDTVPVGKDDSQNVEVRQEGQRPTFAFDFKDHVALGEALDMMDLPEQQK